MPARVNMFIMRAWHNTTRSYLNQMEGWAHGRMGWGLNLRISSGGSKAWRGGTEPAILPTTSQRWVNDTLSVRSKTFYNSRGFNSFE